MVILFVSLNNQLYLRITTKEKTILTVFFVFSLTFKSLKESHLFIWSVIIL